MNFHFKCFNYKFDVFALSVYLFETGSFVTFCDHLASWCTSLSSPPPLWLWSAGITDTQHFTLFA